MKHKWMLFCLILAMFVFVGPSDSKAPSLQERLASGEVIITPTTTGFNCQFLVKGDAQKAWNALENLDSWRKVFSFVLSSYGMKIDGKKDYEARGAYRNYRTFYMKGAYRGRTLRMLFDTTVQGYKPVKPTTTPGRAAPPRRPGRPAPPRRSYFRGGTITMVGPTNNVTGNRFVSLKNFAGVTLSMRSMRMRVGQAYVNAAQVTIALKLNYDKLFLADRAISLFKLDYRSSEFDRQVRLGLHKIASDFQKSFK